MFSIVAGRGITGFDRSIAAIASFGEFLDQATRTIQRLISICKFLTDQRRVADRAIKTSLMPCLILESSTLASAWLSWMKSNRFRTLYRHLDADLALTFAARFGIFLVVTRQTHGKAIFNGIAMLGEILLTEPTLKWRLRAVLSHASNETARSRRDALKSCQCLLVKKNNWENLHS